MLKQVILIAGIAAVGSCLAAASDPWKEKPYQQWDIKDVQKVLSDSPWVRIVIVSSSWQSSSEKAITTTNGGRNSGGTGGSISGSPSDAQAGSNDASFTVSWVSSLTFREAIARGNELRGTPEEKAEEIVKQQPETYVIRVQGSDMTPFTKSDEMSLKQKTYLLTKKSKQKLTPDRVELRRRPNSQQILDVVFYFSKKNASGEATVPGDEKQVEFACETPLTKVKTTFDLTKMNGSNGAADL